MESTVLEKWFGSCQHSLTGYSDFPSASQDAQLSACHGQCRVRARMYVCLNSLSRWVCVCECACLCCPPVTLTAIDALHPQVSPTPGPPRSHGECSYVLDVRAISPLLHAPFSDSFSCVENLERLGRQ